MNGRMNGLLKDLDVPEAGVAPSSRSLPNSTVGPVVARRHRRVRRVEDDGRTLVLDIDLLCEQFGVSRDRRPTHRLQSHLVLVNVMFYFM